MQRSAIPFPRAAVLAALRTPDFEALFPEAVLSEERGEESSLLRFPDGAACVVGPVTSTDDGSVSQVCWSLRSDPATGSDVLLCRDAIELSDLALPDGAPATLVSWRRDMGEASAAAEGFTSAAFPAQAAQSIAATLRGLPAAAPGPGAALSPQDEAIYFGTMEVKLQAVPGASFAHDGATLAVVNSRSRRAAARRRLRDQSDLGEEYAGLYIPSIPAADLWTEYVAGAAGLPSGLQAPLLKTPDGPVRGLRSGCRSCVLPTSEGSYYRLKGCNTYVDGEYGGKDLRVPYPGFPRVPFAEHDPKINLCTFEPEAGASEIRGCTFEHQVHREQLMSELVAEGCGGLRMVCGNEPVGYWRYDVVGDDTPRVPKCCGLFRTVGEKRLASHLLGGLDALLPELAPRLQMDEVMAVFPEERERQWETVTMDPVSQERTTVVHPVRPSWSACCAGPRQEPVDASSLALEEASPTTLPAAAAGNAALGEAWATAAAALAAAVPLSGTEGRCQSLLSYLHWRIGREAGEIKRMLSDKGISWGYFQDHGVEPHNNSHPNNFVVVPPALGTAAGPLLAPVDFDMAYTRDEFFSQMTGELCPEDFDDNLRSELSELERALAGETASTGLEGIDGASGLSTQHQALRWALRDTLLAGFRSAYHNHADKHPRVPAMDAAARHLVVLALVASAGSAS